MATSWLSSATSASKTLGTIVLARKIVMHGAVRLTVALLQTNVDCITRAGRRSAKVNFPGLMGTTLGTAHFVGQELDDNDL